jgi:hypothetical protein
MKMQMTVGQLQAKLDEFVADDPYRKDMRVTNGLGENFLSLDVQRDKHGLMILVLDDKAVRID